MEIQKLAPKDYDRIVKVWEKAGLPFRPAGRDSKNNLTIQLRSNRVIILGAIDENELIGVVMVTHDGRKGWINRLAVIPEYQHKGIASTLIEESEALLRKRGYEVYCVLIEKDRDTSEQLFSKFGYKEEKEIAYFTKRKRKDA